MPISNAPRILSRPRFQDFITVYRWTETIDDNGMANFASTNFPVPAVVMPATGSQLRHISTSSIQMTRTPEGTYTTGAVVVFSKFRLKSGEGTPIDGSESTDADEIIWNGRRYTVQQVDDWNDYGEGYNVALCVMRDINP